MNGNDRRPLRAGSESAAVRIGWHDVPRALELLEAEAGGAYWPSPIGNQVRIDFANETDADMILEKFAQARLIAPQRS